MLTVRPARCDDLFGIWNVSYSCHLLVLSAWSLLCSTQVLVALPHRQNVVDLGHSVQFSFLRLTFHFLVVFIIHCIQCGVVSCKCPVMEWSEPPNRDISAKALACGFWLPPPNHLSPKGHTSSIIPPSAMFCQALPLMGQCGVLLSLNDDISCVSTPPVCYLVKNRVNSSPKPLSINTDQ